MNIKDHLVFCNGEEKTKEIETLQFNKCTNQWQVKFVNNSKIYFYKFSSINEYCDPEKLNLFTYQFKYKGKLLNDVNEVIRFKNHYRFFYKNGIERLIPESEIEIIKNCLSDKLCNDSLKYFQKLSEKISIKYEDGSSLLSKQFSKLQFISDKTVFASYLNPAKYPLKSYKERPLIFPFGCNESQKTAVETALRNQITLIEGPPGTGKTQTILNLIANLLIGGNKIAVVSNNNSATDNVYEKMEKYKLGFLCAVLGNSKNRQNFIENQLICEIQEPKMAEEKWKELLELVDKSQKELSEYLALKNRYAQLETTYNSLLVEQQHFQNYVKEAFQRKKIDITLKLSSIQVLALKASLEDYVEKYGYKQLSWLQKLKLYIFYRIRNREFLTYSLDEIITEFEHQYYDIKQKELEEEQRQIDEIKHTVLPEILASGTCIDDIGIISPYRDQTEIIKLEADEGLTVDTVHKFQGREKDTIIITTVDNEITKFTDNPNLLNVAVSRAAKKLRLIISNNEKNDDTNISDLVRYIAYEKGEILSGRIYSVFDLLYKDYREVREAYMKNKKRISLMDSENLFYYFMQEILASEGIIDLDIAVHIPLRQLIKRVREFTDEEVQYMMQRNTHIDFVLYKKVDKQPIMAIEVDGEQYHRKGSYQKEVRDKLKDSILKKSGLKLLRFSTTGSMEDKKLREALSRP